MSQKVKTVKPDAHGDVIGHIDYPVKFEKAALPVGVIFTLVAAVNMVTGSVSKSISLVFIAVIMIAALYALFRAWPVIQGWFATHPKLSTATHFAMVFIGALVGFALMVGGK